MSLITKEHLNIVLQVIKKILSLKADKTDLETKIDKSELSSAIDVVAELGFVAPISDENGAIYVDENGIIYTL